MTRRFLERDMLWAGDGAPFHRTLGRGVADLRHDDYMNVP